MEIKEQIKQLWSDGPEGYEWLVYTVAGVLLYRAIKYLIKLFLT